MKQLLMILIALFSLSCINLENSDPNRVYICTGKYATTYHRSRSCSGLSNCKGSVESVSKSYAESIGRNQCKRCY